MTPDQIIIEAQGVCSDYTDDYPTTKSVMYRRIHHRQRTLFTLAGTWNREFYGVCTTATLSAGAVDLRDMEGVADVYPVESLERVIIQDPGESSYVAGKEVNVVPVDDTEAHFAPRMTLRSGVLEQVGTDLAGVTSVKLFYSRRPYAITTSGLINGSADQHVDLADPYDWLLVLDLAKDLIRRTISIEKDARDAVIALIAKDEAELMASYESHVRSYAYAREDRFSE